MDDGWSITCGRFRFNKVDELKGAAKGCIGVWPLGTLKVTNF